MNDSATLAKPRLDENYAEFVELVELAQTHHHGGRSEAAAVYAQAAAQHAWMNPNGLFASEDLEEMLSQLAQGLPPVRAGRVRLQNPRKVLHVITQAYQTGGSTQFVACWLDEDFERSHRVCLTQQGTVPVPQKILTRTSNPADLVRLDGRPEGLLDRALMLRRLAAECDVVLLNVHPHDVIPSLAFNGQDGLPPIVLINHADHVFWLGTRVAETVFNMRLSGAKLALDRRGIEPHRSTLGYRPLRPSGRGVSRDDAKRRLGLAPSDVVILTAADGSKYRPLGSESLLDIILPLFEENDDLRLLAAGPTADGEWAAAEDSTQGRLRALGPLPDVSLLHQAADIYLDSYPFSSLTSLLEAGSFGVPGVSLRDLPEACAVLGADTHGLDQYMVRPSDPIRLREELRDLVTNKGRRERLGGDIQRVIVESHTGSGWRASVDELYRTAANSVPFPAPECVAREDQTLDHWIELIMSRTRFSRGIDGVMMDQLNLLPLRQRLEAAYRLAVKGERPGLRELLPAWSTAFLAGRLRRLKSARSA